MDFSFLCLFAFIAGIINAIAGGGTLLVFPALVLSGIPPVIANATSTVALVSGTISSVFGYHKSLNKTANFIPLVLISLLSGGIGAMLLVILPEKIFAQIVPYLVLIATGIFAFSATIKKLIARSFLATAHKDSKSIYFWQFLIGIYGGYFGAGIGIMMLAALSLTHIATLAEGNALKTVMGATINTTAVIIFTISGLVDWQIAIPLAFFAIIGGYTGAKIGTHVPEKYLRIFVVIAGLSMTGYFFINR